MCFHAHPDDEVFTTGGVMRMAADAGHRVVVVTATDGALGEFPDGLLDEYETLAQRRSRELEASTDALGASRVVSLHYPDSGMVGTPENENPEAFCNVDVEKAAERLAEVLREENADVLTIYDPNGGYGHPDHIQVHHVGVRAAELAGTPFVYEASTNRDHMKMLMQANPEWTEEAQPPDIESFGLPADQLTTAVDVSSVISSKRAAMYAHATQVAISARSSKCRRSSSPRHSAPNGSVVATRRKGCRKPPCPCESPPSINRSPDGGFGGSLTSVGMDLEQLVASMPFAVHTGIQLDSAAPEQVVGHLDWDSHRTTAGNGMHGGALMTLADSVGAVCAFLNLPPGASTSTTSSSTVFTRGVRKARSPQPPGHCMRGAAPSRS